MLRHVVMFSWNETVDAAHVQTVSQQLDALRALIPEIVGYQHGPDAGISSGNFDYVVVGDFKNVDDYVVYRDHPDHKAFIATYIAGRLNSRSAVQYELRPN
ncbi:MAG TPA: Dabb family protein [Ilumatobacteraceae bacterium]|nr:Dabb family protein [Ilumatobacteraceae bacterium]HRB04201.1 Dabb family protein [Ilumatobacteraceae bacterium]